MKGPRKLVSGALNSVDIFEDPIHLNMGGETGLTSSLGGFLSLLIMIFIGIQAIFQSIEMFTRDGPQIIQMNEFEDDPELANLSNNNNFVMAVALTSNNNNVDFTVNTPLSFTATYSRYIRSDDGLQVKHKYQIYWAPCTEANFPSSIFPENTFTTYSLKYAYCPTHIDFTDLKTGICDESVKEIYPNCQTPPDFNILGTFLSQDFEFVQFKLNSCTQTDSKHIAGLNCANETVISNTFNTSELTLNLYYSNTLIDPVNYETPNKTYLDTIYWNVHPSVSTVADIFVDTETVQDFNDYFSTEEHTNRTFYSIQRESMRELQKFQASSLLEWNIRRSNLNHLTSRTYTKVLDVISNVGGMSELFIIAGALIAAGYVRYKYQMMLSNELYDFEPDDDKRPRLELPRSPETPFIELTNNFRTDSSTTPTNSKRRTLSQLFNSSFKKKKKKNIYESKSVKEYFEIQKKKKRILDYSEFSYLKAVLNSLICRKVPEEELAKKARNQVVQDLDIVKVVEKLKEIDKLKMLLLNSNQRKAFEFIEKPLITHDDEKPVLVGSMQRIEGFVNVALAGLGRNLINSPTESSVSEYAKVYIAYRALHEDTEIENVKYNNKLLDMINEDLRSVFKKVDQFMGPIPDAKRFDEIVKKLIEQKDLGTTFEDGLHTE